MAKIKGAIAEKPSVAQSLAKNLSAYQRKDGYLEGNSCIVSWCLGHLAEYAPPEFYDEKYAKWQFEDLPIIPEVWKVQVSEDKKKQFEVFTPINFAFVSFSTFNISTNSPLLSFANTSISTW